ncbi:MULTISPECIES: hypothetical protein [Pseudoalteromonas]|uniref:Solute-binding protein family 3/N-terminal domain-containing protein n=1 Tax=Pseudoalteromonas haloplanktis TaxID=228 RepID=A0ABU1BE64_PSEHA|nr:MULTISPECIES: hypothetical protein [Pseudoalteromonas]MCF6144358.1 hypothetical protein [Pseudoalteromonas mariniglutinosa NCIMB 1770]MDQ9092803.1 hypothetical protein [Pseudoalteromonas haloplanktis]BDF96321.1 hypothetical protein KAN5_31590 [Pseudoalteromonas sp. KAN5]
MYKVLLIFFVSLFTTASAANNYTINVSESASYQLGQAQIETLFNKIYAPLDITPHYIFLPSKRGLEQVNAGLYDAEAGRFTIIGNQYKSLLMIPTPLAELKIVLFCIEESFCQLDVNQGFLTISGTLFTEALCESKLLSCNTVINDKSAFIALKKQRAHAIIGNSLFPKGTLCESGLEQVYIREILGQSFPLHHFIHKRHQALLAPLEQSISKLKASGEITVILNEIANEFTHCNGKIIELPPIQLNSSIDDGLILNIMN